MTVEQFKHDIICQFKQPESPAQWLMRRDSRITKAQNQYFIERACLYHLDYNLQIKVGVVIDNQQSAHFEVMFKEDDTSMRSKEIENTYADLSSAKLESRQTVVESIAIQGDTIEFALKYVTFKMENGHLTMSETMSPLGSRAYFSLRTLMMSDNRILKYLINANREEAKESGYKQKNYIEYIGSENDMILLRQALDVIPLNKNTKEDICDIFAKTKYRGYKITALENVMVELMSIEM